jgi:hypothetical protein
MAALGDDFFVQTFTATLQKYEKQLVDNVLLDHPTLELFKQNAKSVTGRGLVIPVRAATLNSTAFDTGSTGSGEFSTAVSSDIMGSAVYNWAKGIITKFRVPHREILQNSGPEQIVNLVEEYVKGASADHGDFITSKLHTLSAVWDSDSFNSLDMLVGNASSDAYYDGVNGDWTAVGGIDPNDAGKSYWQATRFESSAAAEDIVAAFRRATNDIYVASRKRPTHAIVGRDVYEEFEAWLAENGRSVYNDPSNTSAAQTRFNEIRFGELIVRLDPDCQDDRAYLLNKDSLRFAYCAGEFMKTFPAQVLPGTLDTIVPLASTITVGVSERRANGLIIRTA